MMGLTGVGSYDSTFLLDGTPMARPIWVEFAGDECMIARPDLFVPLNCSSGGGGKTGKNMGVCKETFYIHLLASEKSKYLPVIEYKNRISIN